MEKPSLYFWISDGCAWIRVTGRGDVRNATEVKELSKKAISGRGVREFVVDFTECHEIDSTFLGIISGIALRLRELRVPRGVRLVNCSDRTRMLLGNLGLDELFQIEENR